METREYYGQYQMSAAVLPARVVYLIAENSGDGFRSAVREASTRWAGVTEPIVPVTPEGKVSGAWQEIVEAADVQNAVNVDLDEEQAKVAAEQLGLPLVALARIDHEGAGKFTCHPSAIAAADEWGQSYLMAQEDAPLWQIAAAGDLVGEALEAMQKLLPVSRPMSDVQIATAQFQSNTLLDRTRSQFREHSQSGGMFGGPMTIVVTDPDDVDQCMRFWNLRALRPLGINPTTVMLLPRHGVEHWVHFAENVAQHLRAHPDTTPDVNLYGPSIPKEELHALAAVLRLTPDTSTKIKTSAWGGRDPSKELTYLLNQDARIWLLFERSWGRTTLFDAHLYAGQSTIEFSSPVEFSNQGRALARWSSPAFDPLPRRPEIASMVHPQAVWHRDSLQINTRAMRRYRLDISVPDLSAVVERLLTGTVHWELSDKGRLGTALAAQTDVSALLEPSLYEAIIALTTRRTDHFLKAVARLEQQGTELPEGIKDLAADWGSRMDRRYAPARQLQGMAAKDALPALERACSLGWAERGTAIDCSQCRVKSFIPLIEVGQVARCPGCGAASSFLGTATAVDLHYRLNSFMDRASDQGVLPHLMAIAALTRQRPQSHFLPGANLIFDSSERAEVDLYGTFGGQVLAGELKTQASQFHEDQTARDIALSKRLGADVHLMAAIDTIPEATISHARGLCEDHGLELIVLDRQHLRPTPA
ncbi:hypothetical protein PV341_26160 [Streptomyces sp. PA03-1a]|nr:hypothetical protein [Streptomyces sp. PA03-1a]